MRAEQLNDLVMPTFRSLVADHRLIGIETEVEQRGDHIEPVHPHRDGEKAAAEHLNLVREAAFAMQSQHGLAVAEGHGCAGREFGPLLEQQPGRLVKPCRIDARRSP